jgi:proteasome component ECM29
MVSVHAQLGSQLGSILPSLFRYQFDTNRKIQDSMKKMWLTLVPNPREALNTHFDAIISDLLTSMGNRQYRVRNSACAALVELLHGRGMTQLDPYLERLWLNTFRLLDDVNELVRKSASSLAGALSHLSIRLCDTVYSSRPAAQKALAIVLPVLLTQGISSKAKEIQGVSIRAILALIKIGKENLRPHLPTLIGTLLEGMSSLEPAAFSYYQQHAASIGLTDEQLERARLSMASGGPLAEALSSCLLVVDDASVPPIVSKLTDIISTGLGLPTLTAAAKFVVSLANSKSGPAMREHVVPLMSTLQKGLSDQSPTLRKLYADTLGFLCKIAKKKRVEKVLASLHELYTSDKSSETSRLVSGFALRSISRQAGDVLRGNFLPECVPVAWVASHDNTPGASDIAKAWSEALEEQIPGLDNAIPLFQHETVELIRKLLDSQVYALRHIALLALKHLIVACKLRFASEVEALLPQLLKLLPGRLWTGKEVALDVLLMLSQECATKLTAAQARAIVTAVRGECTRNKSEYKREAIRVYGKIVASFPYLSGDETVAPFKEIVQPILDLTASSSKQGAAAGASSGASSAVASASEKKSTDGDEKETGPDVLLVTYTYACLADLLPKPQAAVTALHVLRNLSADAAADVRDDGWAVSQAAHVEWLVGSLLGGLERGFAWTVRVAIWAALKRVVENLYDGEPVGPTVAGGNNAASGAAVGEKKSYGPSLVTPALMGRIGRAVTGSAGLGEPKFPVVRARAVEMLQALVDRPATWAALTDKSVNADTLQLLSAQLLSMRADQDATVLRLAPAIQAKIAAVLA